MTFSRTPAQLYRAPNIGEHSADIARELCGLADGRIAELHALGVFR
jgi:crotonobetainyl-CoA:carnitine CoA-transferase CaiB-like acyl-CoA transferase